MDLDELVEVIGFATTYSYVQREFCYVSVGNFEMGDARLNGLVA